MPSAGTGTCTCMEENLHNAHGARAVISRLGHLIDETDPVNGLVEDRERRDALRDVERRRIDAARNAYPGRDARTTLP